MTIHKNQQQNTSDFVILNSVSFFEKARPFMEQHEAVKLYLDQDTTGQNYSCYALSLSDKYKDESHLYKLHKDFNDWVGKPCKSTKEKLRNKARRKFYFRGLDENRSNGQKVGFF